MSRMLLPLERAFHMRLTILCTLALSVMVSSVTAGNVPSTKLTNRGGNSARSGESASYAAGQEAQASDSKALPVPRPLTSEQTVRNPLQVFFEDGQLTITAENASLSDVLSELRARMGADFDLPANASGNRIWAKLGPGPARRVVADLLSTTDLDYVIQASETDADGIKSILLTPRTKGGAAEGPGRAGQPPMGTIRRLPLQNPSREEVPEQQNPVPAETPASSEAAPATPPVPSTDQQPTASELRTPPAAMADDASRTNPRTTEDMIQQLQSLYQQRKQMQTQQNKNPPAPN
jgi:hypothetical protein